MGEEKKKKEKTKAKESNTSLKNMLLKKKKKTITQYQIFVEAVGFRLELLGFRCSYWVAAHLRMQRNK